MSQSARSAPREISIDGSVSFAPRELPEWSKKKVKDHRREEYLSSTLEEGSVLYHKQNHRILYESKGPNNIPRKYQKPSIAARRNHISYKEAGIKPFPVSEHTKMRNYHPISVIPSDNSYIPHPPESESPRLMSSLDLTRSTYAESIDNPIPDLPTLKSVLFDENPSLIDWNPPVYDRYYLKIDSSKLPPLEEFDDNSLEPHSPEEWLQICTTGKSPYYGDGGWKWAECDIKSYDPSTKRYSIEYKFLNHIKREVTRFNLIFDDEDEEMFRQRVREAMERREEFKQNMRYQYYLDTALPPITSISDEWLDNIYEMVISQPLLKNPNKDSLTQLGKEIKQRYDTSMKVASLLVQLKFDNDLFQTYLTYGLPLPEDPSLKKFVPVPVPYYNFGEYKEPINSSCIVNPNLINLFHSCYTAYQTKIGDKVCY